MKKITQLSIGTLCTALLYLLTACNGQKSNETKDSNAKTKDITGIYTAITPAADCPGIYEIFQLNSDSTYLLIEKYIERDVFSPRQESIVCRIAPLSWTRIPSIHLPLIMPMTT